MSGIVGVVHLDGAPIDRALLQRLTDFQAFRGPDAQHIWVNDGGGGNVGFGHTLLKTTEESEHEHQPFTLGPHLGSDIWIVADARIDAQRDLIAKLQAKGQEVSAPVVPSSSLRGRPGPRQGEPGANTDVELILRAYHTWGQDCVEHLLGDFAFAIWDGPRRRLFCARDHMGVKPFYYAHIGPLFLFSNTLDCIRQHPAVSDKLNDLAIADFLLFGHNLESATTSFADIQRLPPAHCAAASPEGMRLRRYWTMPIDEPLFYKRADDYTDRFKELLGEAVGDRLRTNRIGVFMSGGIDSPTLAAAAVDGLRQRYPTWEVKAFSIADPNTPEETHFAQLAADALGIPVCFRECSDEQVDPNWEKTSFHMPEPRPSGWQVLPNQQYYRQIATFARVFFYGEGPDNALILDWRSYLAYLVRTRRFGRLAQAVWSTSISQRRPPFGGRIYRRWKQFGRRKEPQQSFPPWLNHDFELRWNLRAGRKSVQCAQLVHPLRSQGYASLQIPLWQVLFEAQDAASTITCMEVRHPFVDLRMLRFLLAVPPLPWCRSKRLLRRAMQGVLPGPLLRRPKFSVGGESLQPLLMRLSSSPLTPDAALASYVDVESFNATYKEQLGDLQGGLRVRSLNQWLQNSRNFVHNDVITKAVRLGEDLS